MRHREGPSQQSVMALGDAAISGSTNRQGLVVLGRRGMGLEPNGWLRTLENAQEVGEFVVITILGWFSLRLTVNILLNDW